MSIFLLFFRCFFQYPFFKRHPKYLNLGYLHVVSCSHEMPGRSSYPKEREPDTCCNEMVESFESHTGGSKVSSFSNNPMYHIMTKTVTIPITNIIRMSFIYVTSLSCQPIETGSLSDCTNPQNIPPRIQGPPTNNATSSPATKYMAVGNIAPIPAPIR